MVVYLLTNDLMTSSQVAGTASRCGLELQTLMSADELLTAAAQRGPNSVFLDLSMPNIDVAALVRDLRNLELPPERIVAFGPHVHGPLLQQAKHAGCDEVLTRGQFHANLEAVLIGP